MFHPMNPPICAGLSTTSAPITASNTFQGRPFATCTPGAEVFVCVSHVFGVPAFSTDANIMTQTLRVLMRRTCRPLKAVHAALGALGVGSTRA